MGIVSSSFAAGSLVLTLFACGGSGNNGSSFTVITPTTMQALAGTLCNKVAECTSDLFVQAAYGSAETCRSRLLQELQASTKGLGYGVSEQGGAACNTALGSAACADVLSDAFPTACRFTGTLADGTSCTDDAQCVSGSCFIDDAATCGKCSPRAALGADCTNAKCEGGLTCGSGKKCSNGQAGEACGKDEDCRALTSCRAGVCVEPLQEGVACKEPADVNAPCDLSKALFCVADKCTKATIAVANNGEKCGLTSDSPLGVTLCSSGECVAEKCVPHAADGTTCTTGSDTCQAPAKCRNGICALKDPNLCK